MASGALVKSEGASRKWKLEEKTRNNKSEQLVAAAEAGNIEQVSRLVEVESVDPNCHDFKRYRTPLHAACANSRIDVVEKLLKLGARIYDEDTDRWDALCWACWGAGNGIGWVPRQTHDMIVMLLKAHKDLADNTRIHQTATGHTALMLYCKYVGNKKKDADLAGTQSKKADDKALRDEQVDILKRLVNNVPEIAHELVEKRNNFGQTVHDFINTKKDFQRAVQDVLQAIEESPEFKQRQKAESKKGGKKDDQSSSEDRGSKGKDSAVAKKRNTDKETEEDGPVGFLALCLGKTTKGKNGDYKRICA